MMAAHPVMSVAIDGQFTVFFAAVVALLGLCFGSFLNVVIYRMPRGESIVTGRSHCTLCGHVIAWYDLIPLVSYLMLGGKCRHCKAAISRRYPLVECLTAGLFLALYLHFGWHPILLKYLFLAALLVAVSFIDLEHFIIPNRLVLAGVIFGIGFGFFIHDISLWSALLGAVSTAGFLLLVALISRGGMGLGDVKLAVVTGLFWAGRWACWGCSPGYAPAGCWGSPCWQPGSRDAKTRCPSDPSSPWAP